MKESQNIEWKETWRDEFLRGICGFANAEGGVLHIGRNNRGAVVGLPDAARLLEEIPNKVRDLLGILVDVRLRREAGQEFIEIAVEPYLHPISYRGRYFRRSGSTTLELTGVALDRFLLRRQGRTWDSVPVPGVKAADLSASAIQRFRELARASGRLDSADSRTAKSALIGKLLLTEGRHLKRAAVLLFHDDPEKFVTGAFVKIGFFRSESDLAYHDTLHGNLFTQVAGTIDLVRTKYLKAAISYQGIQRIERYPVPDAALREAILNALVHRDYAVGAPVQIRVHENRLSIWNPCVLPEGWTLKTLLGTHPSTPFNPAIANVFFRSGEIETWGRGILRIFTACREAGLPRPRLKFDGTGLTVEFRYASAYLLAMPGRETTPRTAERQVGPDMKQPESQPESRPESLDERILGLLRSGPMSKAEISAGLGHKEVSGQLNKIMRMLLADQNIEYTLPTKPNSRLQKYRLTTKTRT